MKQKIEERIGKLINDRKIEEYVFPGPGINTGAAYGLVPRIVPVCTATKVRYDTQCAMQLSP